MALPAIVGALLNDIYELKLVGSHGVEEFLQIYGVSEEARAEWIKDEELARSLSELSEDSLEALKERSDSLLRLFAANTFAPGNFVQDAFIDQMMVGALYERNIMQFGPYPLPDEELKALEVPTLFLVGDQEILYAADPEQVLERAEELVEGIQTALIPNAGHLLHVEQPELCNSHILDFLSGDE